MAEPGNFPAIFADTSDPHVRTAMAFGSDLESGWSGTAVGDQGTSFGWYQIHLPAHPGVTAAEAEDAAWSTKYMLGAYKSAVAQVPGSLWSSNPELAAAQSVWLAERPAGPEPSAGNMAYGGESAATVNQKWGQTASALKGKVNLPGGSGSGSGGSTPAQTTSIFSWPGDIINVFTDISDLFKMQGSIIQFLADPKDALERIGLVLFGAVFIILGMTVLVLGGGRLKSAAGMAVGGATRGASSRISGAVSGVSADKQRRLQISEKANELGERKLALKEKREQRLSVNPPRRRPPPTAGPPSSNKPPPKSASGQLTPP